MNSSPRAIGIGIDQEHLHRDAVAGVGKYDQADQQVVLIQPPGHLIGAQTGGGEHGGGGKQRHDRQQEEVAEVTAAAPNSTHAHGVLVRDRQDVQPPVPNVGFDSVRNQGPNDLPSAHPLPEFGRGDGQPVVGQHPMRIGERQRRPVPARH